MSSAQTSKEQQTFVQWMNENGFCLHSHIKLVESTGYLVDDQEHKERRVVASKQLKDGDIIFKIPREMMLSAANSNLFSVVPEEDVISTATSCEWNPLLLAMMYEYTRGPESKWAPYLAVLPQSLNTPLFWTPEELEELKGTSVLDKIGKEDIERSYNEDILPLIRKFPNVFNEREHTLEMYKRMGSIVMAYSFCDDDTGEVSMVPMADMLNHKTGFNNARLFEDGAEDSDEDSSKTAEDEDEDEEKQPMAMVMIKDCPTGDEIFNTYGDLPNAELLRKYGFVDDINPHDIVEVPLRTLIRICYDHIRAKEQTRSTTNDDSLTVAGYRTLLKDKLQYLKKQDLIYAGDDDIEFNLDGSSKSVSNSIADSDDILTGIEADYFIFGYDLEIPEELPTVTKVLLMNQAQFGEFRFSLSKRRLMAKGKNKSTGSEAATATSKPIDDLEVHHAMLQLIDEKINEYATSLEDDYVLAEQLKSALENADMRNRLAIIRRSAAVIVRMGEKEILHGIREKLCDTITAAGSQPVSHLRFTGSANISVSSAEGFVQKMKAAVAAAAAAAAAAEAEANEEEEEEEEKKQKEKISKAEAKPQKSTKGQKAEKTPEASTSTETKKKRPRKEDNNANNKTNNKNNTKSVKGNPESSEFGNKKNKKQKQKATQQQEPKQKQKAKQPEKKDNTKPARKKQKK